MMNSSWKQMDLHPRNEQVLLKTKGGHVFAGIYLEKFTCHTELKFDGDTDYCKVSELYFLPEGWYKYPFDLTIINCDFDDLEAWLPIEKRNLAYYS